MDYSNKLSEKQYKYFINNLSSFPFSFKYGDTLYEGFNPEYFILKKRGIVKSDDKETTTILLSLNNELLLKLIVSYYYNYGIYEWTVHFINNTKERSKIISVANSTLKLFGNLPVLKGIHGDLQGGYYPYQYDLNTSPVIFVSSKGRATHIHFPYFNLEYGNKGTIFAIGWAGTWKAKFDYDKATNITTYTAQNTINLSTYLEPNEEIRTALFLVGNYSVRDENYATNFWRSWYINCNMPKYDIKGNSIKPFSTVNFACDTGRPNSDGSISETSYTWKPSFEKMLKENINIDVRWIDAGWYSSPSKETVESDWWGTIGSWDIDKIKWPYETMLHTTEYARENNMKTMLWFEPERVTNIDDLKNNYGYNPDWAIGYNKGRSIIANNIGNKDCFNWTLNRILETLDNSKVEIYREDYNYDPISLWQLNDNNIGPNRNGFTECSNIDAHYKLWDSIIDFTKRNNGCSFVDSCASGGGRNDIESMKRGLPVLRSDSDRTSTSLRLSISSSLNKWLPFAGANTKEKKNQTDITGTFDLYTLRASYLPIMNFECQFTQNKNENFDIIRQALREWKDINNFLLKDFYCLSQYHMPNDKTGFTSFAYNDDSLNTSVLFVFRMEDCFDDTFVIKLPYINPEKQYIIFDYDTMDITKVSGKDLKNSFKVTIKNKRESKLFKIYLT